MSPIRCLHQWKPHGGRPVSSLLFLDDHKNPNPSNQFCEFHSKTLLLMRANPPPDPPSVIAPDLPVSLFSGKFAVTGCDNNNEIKLWSCENWSWWVDWVLDHWLLPNYWSKITSFHNINLHFSVYKRFSSLPFPRRPPLLFLLPRSRWWLTCPSNISFSPMSRKRSSTSSRFAKIGKKIRPPFSPSGIFLWGHFLKAVDFTGDWRRSLNKCNSPFLFSRLPASSGWRRPLSVFAFTTCLFDLTKGHPHLRRRKVMMTNVTVLSRAIVTISSFSCLSFLLSVLMRSRRRTKRCRRFRHAIERCRRRCQDVFNSHQDDSGRLRMTVWVYDSDFFTSHRSFNRK